MAALPWPPCRARGGRNPAVRVVTLPDNHYLADMALFGEADLFIGNCVSSFTAFAKRARDAAGKPSRFFGVPADADASL